jgi:hypothetical protein
MLSKSKLVPASDAACHPSSVLSHDPGPPLRPRWAAQETAVHLCVNKDLLYIQIAVLAYSKLPHLSNSFPRRYLVTATFALTTFPSRNTCGPKGISPSTDIASWSSEGPSVNTHFNSPPYISGKLRGSTKCFSVSPIPSLPKIKILFRVPSSNQP